ncbi:MAG: S53 family peptidase [Firmicutes bacterium]|nr:S53 family peptidase [Bacillota bacterium]
MRLSGHLLPNLFGGTWSSVGIGPDRVELAVVLQGEASGAAAGALGPMPRDVRERFRLWLTREGLAVTRESPSVLQLVGSFTSAARTFDLGFEFSSSNGLRYFRPNRDPEVADWAARWVVGVIGLENVARLRPRWRHPQRRDQLANDGRGFFPADLVAAYRFPDAWTGAGMTLGLLEFSSGYSLADVEGFWRAMGVAPPKVTFVSVDGTPNDGGRSADDVEATLDLSWAGALAPGAHLVVYEASGGTTDASFGLSLVRALDYAIYDDQNRPAVLSISYGDGETRFPLAEMMAWDFLILVGSWRGVTTFVASGDQGAYGLHEMGLPICHVDAPANCPHAVAVGGTHLVLNPDRSIRLETGWTETNNNGASGGGISQVFGVPPYQEGLVLPLKPGLMPGRGVPDVAANADPDTGYALLFQGQWLVVGGTSAAAALWARLEEARRAANQPPLGLAHEPLYRLGGTPAFHDITVGNNNYDGVVGYRCGPGWDAVTGWGSPDATCLIADLAEPS